MFDVFGAYPIDQGLLMRFSPLCQSDFEQLTHNAKVLELDSFGPKVLQLEGNLFLKLFRRKRWLSSALWRPYSLRFIENAQRLKSLGIPTLTPLELFRLDDRAMTAVHYQPLPGRTFRQLSEQPGFDWQPLLPSLADLIHQLHALGIYFRSLHLGNIVQTPEGSLGLIDISDMRFFRHALSQKLAQRNLKHFQHYLQREKLEDRFPFEELRRILAQRRLAGR